MTYAVANLYGRLDRFNKLLERISFGDNDVMYILGNIVDYGEQSLELINDISVRYNVYSVLGEHDYKAYMLLSEFDKMLRGGGAPTPEFSRDMIAWSQMGGMATLEAFKGADKDTREGFLEYLSELPVFEEAEVSGKEYVLISSGINDFDPEKDLLDYSLEDVVGAGFDMDKEYFEDRTTVVGYLDYGHTPAGASGKICKKGSNIALACDVSENDEIACLCLENGREYYV